MADSLKIRIDGDTSGYKKALSGLGDMTKKGINTIKNAAIGLGAAAAAGIAGATKAGMQFEEAMSQVQAISMATGEEYDMLKAKAQEMGETTKFSATESAEALQYLSLAGYNAEESCKALPQVLNLAAAGGMELAYASDLLTDSMAVMGLGIDNMENFSDQLAMAASKSNTSVQQLGEAVLVAGGQAKLANMSVTEMNTALGILADKGIKGSEGGTALRNTLKNLYTPTDNAAKMLEKLGVKTSDAQGNLIPMQDVLKTLNDSLSTLTSADKISAMGEIFDTRTIAAASALLDDCGSRWTELSGYLSDCDGAAQKMADTMNDNLKGQLVLAASAAEGLGIAVYDSIGKTLKESVKQGAKEISNLTRSIKSGELKPALENMGKLVSILADTLIKFATTVIPQLIKVLGFLGEHFASVSTFVLAATAAFKTFAIVSTITKVISANNAVLAAHAIKILSCAAAGTVYTGQLTVQSAAVGLLTGKITLATAAQTIWNAVMSANHVGLLIAGIVALGVAIAGALFWYDSYLEKNSAIVMATQAIADKAHEAAEKTNEMSDALSSLHTTYSGNIEDAEATASANKTLTDELYNLAGQTSLTADQKDRMKTIVEQLNGSIDGLNLAFNEETGKLNLTKDAVMDLITQKLELAKTNAIAELYTEHLKEQYKAEAEATKIAKDRKSAQDELNKILEDEKVRIDDVHGVTVKHTYFTREQKKAIENLKKSIEDYDGALATSKKSVTDSYDKMQDLATVAGVKLPESFEESKEKSKVFFDGVASQTKTATAESEKNGVYFGQGYAKGISSQQQPVYKEGYNLGVQALKGTADAQRSQSPAKETIKLGKYNGQGYAIGISSTSALVRKSASEMAEEALDAISHITEDTRTEVEKINNESNEELLESEKFYQSEKDRLDEDYADRKLKQQLANAKTEKARQNILSKQKLTDAKKANELYLEVLKESADKERKIYDALQKDIENEKKQIVTIFKDMAQEAFDSIADIEKAEKTLADKLKSYGGALFTERNIKIKSGDGVMQFNGIEFADLNEQTQSLKRYGAALTSLREKADIPQEFFEALRDMSVDDGTKFAEALLNADEKTFIDYIQQWKEKQEVSEEISKQLYEPEIERAKKMLEEKFGTTVPQDFFSFGEEAAKKYGEGFIGQLQGVIEEVQAKLNAAMASITPKLALIGAGGGGNVYNTNNTKTVNINADGVSPVEIQKAEENQEIREMVTGGY